MAIHLSCDGCGQAIEGAGHKAGYTLVRDYCDGCWTMIEDYMTSLEDIRKRSSMLYEGQRKYLIERMLTLNERAKLPDVP